MGELADKVKQRSPFLRLEDGESVVATYKSFKMIPSSYDPLKEVFRFTLEIEVDGEKQEKFWDTGANKVAMVFDALQPGDKVKITKNIDNPGTPKEKTNWTVEPVKAETEEKAASTTTAKVSEEEAREIEESMAEGEPEPSSEEEV
jgi:hypothetical protein